MNIESDKVVQCYFFIYSVQYKHDWVHSTSTTHFRRNRLSYMRVQTWSEWLRYIQCIQLLSTQSLIASCCLWTWRTSALATKGSFPLEAASVHSHHQCLLVSHYSACTGWSLLWICMSGVLTSQRRVYQTEFDLHCMTHSMLLLMYATSKQYIPKRLELWGSETQLDHFAVGTFCIAWYMEGGVMCLQWGGWMW